LPIIRPDAETLASESGEPRGESVANNPWDAGLASRREIRSFVVRAGRIHVAKEYLDTLHVMNALGSARASR